ncbi:helix-turn-helix domain-containing protein [Microbacterium sp. 179-I 3D4 NHS]|uniref:helix-turn-helix domain-containing protein n=1 Tax=Microbacterium sp. 179-I 3D4 NHS TaxID=3142381 RepID=UPI0039A08C66
MTAFERHLVAEAVADALQGEKRSKRWLARRSEIPLSTLRRKMQGKADFTVTEIARIAEALEVSPASLLPPLRSTGEVAGPGR